MLLLNDTRQGQHSQILGSRLENRSSKTSSRNTLHLHHTIKGHSSASSTPKQNITTIQVKAIRWSNTNSWAHYKQRWNHTLETYDYKGLHNRGKTWPYGIWQKMVTSQYVQHILWCKMHQGSNQKYTLFGSWQHLQGIGFLHGYCTQ